MRTYRPPVTDWVSRQRLAEYHLGYHDAAKVLPGIRKCRCGRWVIFRACPEVVWARDEMAASAAWWR